MRILILSLTLLSLYACNNRSDKEIQTAPNPSTGTRIKVSDTSLSDTLLSNTQNAATRDVLAGKAKYYFFGISSADPLIVAGVKEKFHLELVSRGCIIISEEKEYNDAIDRIMYEQYKQTIAAYISTFSTHKKL